MLLELSSPAIPGLLSRVGAYARPWRCGGGATVRVSGAICHYPLADEGSEFTRRNVRATPSNMPDDRSTPLRAANLEFRDGCWILNEPETSYHDGSEKRVLEVLQVPRTCPRRVTSCSPTPRVGPSGTTSTRRVATHCAPCVCRPTPRSSRSVPVAAPSPGISASSAHWSTPSNR